MSGYNFFNYNPAGGLSLPPPPQQYGGGGGGGPKRGQCSVPGCRNGHLEIRYKCQNCQAQLHYECTHNRDDQGHCWCPYDCSSTVNNNLNQMVNPQLLQLQQMQQQHHQPMQQQMQQQPPHQQQQQQHHHQHQQQQQQQPFFFGANMGGNLNPQNLNQQLQQGIQQHQQQLQNQAQQFQQLAASVQGGPSVAGIDDPTGLVAAIVDPGGVVDPNSDLAAFDRVGNLNKQGPMGDDDDDDDEDHALDDADSEEDDDDDDDDDLVSPQQRAKRTAAKAGATKAKGGRRPRSDPNRLTRRQQPPKTNITRTRYSNDFKMRVVSEVEQPGYGSLADISKHYGVAEQTLRDWVKNKDKIQQAVIRRGNLKANPVDYLKHVTQALLKFMDERQQMGIEQPVTARMIAAKGEEIKNRILAQDAQSPFLTENERKFTKKFSASLSWGKKWVRQYGRSRKPTQVPADLEDLPKEELVRLLRSVASEREILERNAASGPGLKDAGHEDLARMVDNSAQAPKASTALLPFIPSPPRVKPPPAFKCDQVKAHIAEMAAYLIKKKGHNWKGRPTTEVTEEIPSLEAARELFKGYPEINKTARSYRWNLTGEQVIEWLGCPKYVHPVKFEGKVIVQIGQISQVYAFAGYDSLLAKYEQGTGTLTLKFKTFTAGTGNIPGSDEPVFLCNES